MKKILFTLLSASLFHFTNVQAQNMEFRFHHTKVENGATVVIQSEEDVWEEGKYEFATNPVDDPFNGLIVYNYEGEDVDFTAKMTILNNTAGVTEYTWCMGGDCITFTGTERVKDGFIMAESDVQVQYDAYPNTYGEVLSKLELQGTSGGKIDCLIRFVHSDPAGISLIQDDANASVNVYDLSGKQVVRNAGAQTVGLLNKGVYIVETIGTANRKTYRKVTVK